jgi:3'-phosphoadenosine 5'-phosphosulfate sulfotransferase (PAPS reductase)/FAD synthetase
MRKLISFSGGRSSAYMTYRLRQEGYIQPDDVIVFANTGKEREETLEFVHECDKQWNLNVVWVEYTPERPLFKVVDFNTASRNGEPFEILIDKRKFLPNVVTRFCTGDLKIKPMKRYMKSLGIKRWIVTMGIRYDEPLRWGRILQNTQAGKEPFVYDLPMVDWLTSKTDVMEFWANQPFDLGITSDEGNCDLCFLKGKAKLAKLIKAQPERAQWWITQEEKRFNDKETQTGNRFRNQYTVAELRHIALTQTELFEETIDYPCHCNID